MMSNQSELEVTPAMLRAVAAWVKSIALEGHGNSAGFVAGFLRGCADEWTKMGPKRPPPPRVAGLSRADIQRLQDFAGENGHPCLRDDLGDLMSRWFTDETDR